MHLKQQMKIVNKAVCRPFFLALLFCIFSMLACSPTVSESANHRTIQPEGVALTPPPGVVRYCWEEPMVDYERVNPGLDSEGKWYNPAHVAVKEVRMGRWRPCNEIRSRTYGRYGDEH